MGWRSRRSRYGGGYGDGYGGFAPYVPVAQRRANAANHAQKLAKKEGRQLTPVSVAGRAIATSFWGKAWCDNLESYSDFANRLPRGRTYARNGSVIDLQIKRGKIEAIVSGSHIYTVSISITTLARDAWGRVKQECSQSISSLIDLLQGRFDEGVMKRLAHPTDGLFPQPNQIKMKCSCPDSAGLCKHLAAVLYGVGARLDTVPELLFTLRNVDHLELISQAVAAENLDQTLSSGQNTALAGSDLGELFGIDLDAGSDAGQTKPKKPTRRKRATTAQAPTEPIAPPEPAAPQTRRRAVVKPNAMASRKRTVKVAVADKPEAAGTTSRKRAAAPKATRRKAR